MTIAAVWEEDGFLWCAADTRLVAGAKDAPQTEIGSKIYAIPMIVAARMPDSSVRMPHFWTQYGFVYAGAALPASMTAITAATLLQKLVRDGGNQVMQPRFEEVAELVFRLAKRFILERRRLGADGLFSAAFFGWCAHDQMYRVAHIEGVEVAGNWEVRLSYPDKPAAQGAPWLVLGSARDSFNAMYEEWVNSDNPITKRVARRVIEKMVAEGVDPTVGGATSIGAASQSGFELFYSLEKVEGEEPTARGVFNGLDLETEVGEVGQYRVGIIGLA